MNQDIIMGATKYSDAEAKSMTQHLVKSTMEMVKASSSFQMEGIFQDELINNQVEKCTGAISKHMIRSYLKGLAFFEFYNTLLSSSYAVAKLRIEFKKQYLPLYATLLPHLDNNRITLERVFHGGLRVIPPHLLQNWAVGLLLHDIGKKPSVEYNERETNYDRNSAMEHVKLGISSITNKTNYCKEAAIIAGYHHEYYGHKDGFGIYTSYLNNFRKSYPDKFQDYCIGFELENLSKCDVLAYFPAKVLEIIDVYDTLTGSDHASGKVLSHSEAIRVMEGDYVMNYRKLDPILFNIFKMFKGAKGYFKYS